MKQFRPREFPILIPTIENLKSKLQMAEPLGNRFRVRVGWAVAQADSGEKT